MDSKSGIESLLDNLREADTQGITGLISTAAISGIVLHIAFTKLLLKVGAIQQTDIDEARRTGLNLSGYPPKMTRAMEPIRTSMQREFCID